MSFDLLPPLDRILAKVEPEITGRNQWWYDRLAAAIKAELLDAYGAGRESAFNQVNTAIHGNAERRAMRIAMQVTALTHNDLAARFGVSRKVG